MKIYINPDDNKEYGAIIEKYNTFMDVWNEINKNIFMFRIPSFYKSSSKKKLLEIGKEVYILQKEWIEHNKNARNWAVNPKFIFPHDTNHELAFHHFNNTLIDIINQFRFSMYLIESNYCKRYEELMAKRSFDIAIGSFIIGICGLIIAILK